MGSDRDLYLALSAFRAQVLDRMQSGLAEEPLASLPLPQAAALAAIARAAPLTIGELTAKLHRSQATTSHLVSQLERRGLVRRSDDPADARRTRIELSAKGQRLVSRLEELRIRALHEVLGPLPAPVRRQLREALIATLSALQASS